MPTPLVAGSCTTPNADPPNSSVTPARCDPGATAIADGPAATMCEKSGKYWTFVGADHVPGAPGVNVACDRSVRRIEGGPEKPENSTGATAIPVLQSSAVASSSNSMPVTGSTK